MEVYKERVSTSAKGDATAKYLLQYILSARGICHENSLILALMRLETDASTFDAQWSIQQWIDKLNDHINAINVRLNLLGYKIVRINHGIGRNAVTMKNRKNFGLFENNAAARAHGGSAPDSQVTVLPESNRFFVYVNLASTEETKLATRFNQNEIEFIKWAIEQFMVNGETIIKGPALETSVVVKEINCILMAATGNSNLPKWVKSCTFTVGSTDLLQFQELTAMEIEDLLLRLCELKWFYRTREGKLGIDLRCIAELEEYLTSTYNLNTCQNCHKLVLQGVRCGHESCRNENNEDGENGLPQIWHVDCFKHYITHVSKNCDRCGSLLITDGVYVL
ncbi:Smc5-Smc6 complex subunit NSE1 [Saccharomyces eubayanus]|uniref:Smc5-Smc6 complex subunit NSE1 n=1 Tax=Saccharomyces eubayanus TaxID=1080349 RepID=UPI0006C3EC40|nr:NSE1-like protein [Saccharomyces eubayanus]KOG97721.1 NSE1-like protein [Saccharomyces eubayanus]